MYEVYMQLYRKVTAAILVIFLIVLPLVGFVFSLVGHASETKPVDRPRFEVIKIMNLGSMPDRVSIFVDTVTGVMYMYAKSGQTGSLVVMVDETGAPLIWKGA